MRKTRKLRKVVPAEMFGKSREASLWDNYEISRGQALAADEKEDDDTWAELLDEQEKPTKLIYDNGTWHVQGDMASLRETRDCMKAVGLPDTHVGRFPKRSSKK